MASIDFPAWYSAGVFGGIGCALLSAVTIAVWAVWRRRGVTGQAIVALLVTVIASALDIGPLLWIEYRLDVFGPKLDVSEVAAALVAAALVGWVAPLATLCWYLLLATPTIAPASARGARGAYDASVSPAALDDPDRAQSVYAGGLPWALLSPIGALADSATPSRPITLTQRLTLIGREVDNDLVLDDERISRRHAELRWDHGRVELLDYGSLNGTRVNERAARGRSLLRDGDIIELGKRRYQLMLRPGALTESGQPDHQPEASDDPALERLETRKTARAADSSVSGRPALRLALLQGAASAPATPWLLSAALTTIGRDPSCGITVADTSISRVHAQITRQPAGFFITDLQSSNGVYLNGQRLLGPAQIFAGDIVTLGDCLFRCEEVTPDASAPAAAAPASAPEAGAVDAPTATLAPTGAPEFYMRIAPEWGARRESRPRLAPPRLRPTPPQRDTPLA